VSATGFERDHGHAAVLEDDELYTPHTAMRAAACISLPLALLVAFASLGGIVMPATYARETASWAAQGVGQDWANLVLVVPWLIGAAIFTLRGSRRAVLLLGAALVYTLYSYVIYAFAVHFNALFLIYCVVLGLAFFTLLLLLRAFLEVDVSRWYDDRAPVKTAGILQIVVALVFGGLWLSEIVPAMLAGGVPASLTEGGFFTNPVHVLDLSILLPALAMSGYLLLRRHSTGYLLAPILLGFAVLMAAAIAGMIVMMARRGIAIDPGSALVLAAMSLASAIVLAALLRRVHEVQEHGTLVGIDA
jgi:hypothetical protein